MLLQDICNKNVVSIAPVASALQAAGLKKEKHMGELVGIKAGSGNV